MKNFFDCKDEKITEKAFSQALLISVISILLCIVALCSMTYAWFNGEIKSSENTITSGSFDLEVVSVEKIENNIAAVHSIKIDENENGVLSCTLSDAGTYRITLKRTKSSTANGYCFVQVGSGAKQPTENIIDANDENARDTNPFTFIVTTTEANTTVEFTPWWGVHTNPVIMNNREIPITSEQETTE